MDFCSWEGSPKSSLPGAGPVVALQFLLQWRILPLETGGTMWHLYYSLKENTSTVFFKEKLLEFLELPSLFNYMTAVQM